MTSKRRNMPRKSLRRRRRRSSKKSKKNTKRSKSKKIRGGVTRRRKVADLTREVGLGHGGSALPTLLEAAEFQNQHEDFTAATTDSEVVKEPVSGRRCLKTKRLDTIGFHKPEKVCHRLQACPSLEDFPWRKRGKMTDSEVQMKIAEA